MSLLDKLREESSSGHVAFTEFALKLNINADYLFCFLEGNDDHKYYDIRIAGISPRQFHTISCGGKDHVQKVKQLISQTHEYDTIDIAYIIDEDYDGALEVTGLYCLPSYSIENQYSNTETLKKILLREFSMKEEHPDYTKAIEYFIELQTQFHLQTLMINAWLACQNDSRKLNNISTRLKIDNSIGKYFNSVVNDDLKTISKFDDLNHLDSIQSLFHEAPIVSEIQLNSKIALFKTLTPEKIFRGKFQLKFFVSFLDRFKNHICQRKPTFFEAKHKCPLRFEYTTSLTSLSIYANTPASLYNYLISIASNAA